MKNYYFGPTEATKEASRRLEVEIRRAGFEDYDEWETNDKSEAIKCLNRIGKEVSLEYIKRGDWWNLPPVDWK